MTPEEMQQLRDMLMGAGWNTALYTASTLLRSPIIRADATREEIAAELDRLQIDPGVTGHAEGPSS